MLVLWYLRWYLHMDCLASLSPRPSSQPGSPLCSSSPRAHTRQALGRPSWSQSPCQRGTKQGQEVLLGDLDKILLCSIPIFPKVEFPARSSPALSHFLPYFLSNFSLDRPHFVTSKNLLKTFLRNPSVKGVTPFPPAPLRIFFSTKKVYTSNKMLRRPTSVILNVMFRAPADKSSQQRPHHNIRFCHHIYYNPISTPYLIFVRNARNAVSVNLFWLSVKKYFVGVKFPGLKMCECKTNDKYQVWSTPHLRAIMNTKT